MHAINGHFNRDQSISSDNNYAYTAVEVVLFQRWCGNHCVVIIYLVPCTIAKYS